MASIPTINKVAPKAPGVPSPATGAKPLAGASPPAAPAVPKPPPAAIGTPPPRPTAAPTAPKPPPPTPGATAVPSVTSPPTTPVTGPRPQNNFFQQMQKAMQLSRSGLAGQVSPEISDFLRDPQRFGALMSSPGFSQLGKGLIGTLGIPGFMAGHAALTGGASPDGTPYLADLAKVLNLDLSKFVKPAEALGRAAARARLAERCGVAVDSRVVRGRTLGR